MPDCNIMVSLISGNNGVQCSSNLTPDNHKIMKQNDTHCAVVNIKQTLWFLPLLGVLLTFPAGCNWFSQAGKPIRSELLYKKNFLLDGETSHAKLSSQPANLLVPGP